MCSFFVLINFRLTPDRFAGFLLTTTHFWVTSDYFFLVFIAYYTLLTHSLSFPNGFCLLLHISDSLQFTYARFRTLQHTSDSILSTSPWFLNSTENSRLTSHHFLYAFYVYLHISDSLLIVSKRFLFSTTRFLHTSVHFWKVSYTTAYLRFNPWYFYMVSVYHFILQTDSLSILYGFSVKLLISASLQFTFALFRTLQHTSIKSWVLQHGFCVVSVY